MSILTAVIISLNLSLSSGVETRFFRDSTVRLIEETDVNVWQENFAAGISYYLYYPENEIAFQKRIGVTKGFVEVKNDYLLLRAGSSYLSFGRGLIFQAVRDDILKMDRFVDGVYAELAKDFLDLKAFGGVVRYYLDHKLQPDSTNLLLGMDGDLRLFEGVVLGGSALRAGERTDYYAARSALEYGDFSLYFEYGIRSGYSSILQDEKQGAADYLSISYSREKFGLLFEFRDYWLFGKDYGLPPTLNKNGIYLNEAMDERGYSFSFNFNPMDEISTNISAANIYSLGYFGDKSELKEVTFQAQYQTDERFAEVDFGYLDITGGQVAIGVETRKEIDPQFEYAFSAGKFEIEAYFRNRIREDEDVKYTDRDIALTLGFLDGYSITWTSQTRAGDLSDRWMNVEFKGQILENLNLILTVGSMRGDFVCSGGICRYEPEFDGVMLKALITF